MQFKPVLISLGIVLAISGCSSENKQKYSDEYVNLVKSISTDYDKYSVEYGVKSITSSSQKIDSIDCTVFNNAAKVRPTSIGGAIAWFESMEIRAKIGCGQEPLEILSTYETSRRLLRDSWNFELGKIPYSEQPLLENSSSAQKIIDKSQRVINESLACQTLNAVNQRKSGTSRSIRIQEERCKNKTYPKFADACQESWHVAMGNQYAQGKRDERAWLSELASRYRMKSYICYPNAVNDYMQFHASVPKEIFGQKAYRLTIPMDTLDTCIYQKVSERRAKNRYNVNDYSRAFDKCASELNLSKFYNTKDSIPYRFNLDTLFNSDSWLYDPTKAENDPARWTFGNCEKQAISMLQANRLNIPSPEAIKSYCKDQNKQRKDFVPSAPILQ